MLYHPQFNEPNDVDRHLDQLDTTNVSRRDFMALASAGVAASYGAAALGLPGVAIASETSRLTFLAFTTRIEYIIQASKSMEAASKELGFKFSMLDGQFNSTRQLNQMETSATRGTRAVILQAPDGSNLRRIAEVAKKNKIYFGNVWATLPWYTPFNANEYYGLYAVPDCVTAMRDVTRVLLKAVMERWGGGEILGVTGLPGFSTDNVRSRGRDLALKEFPKCKLVAHLPGNWNREDSLKAAEALIARYPKARGIVAQNDDEAQGVLAALRANGYKPGEDILVVGADGTSQGVKAIAAGEQLGTCANSPAFMGAMFTAYLYDLLHGWKPRDAERMLYWRSVILTKANLDVYKKRYVTNGDVPPFLYGKMSKILHPHDWDPQNDVFPMDIDHEFTGMPKPANFKYPAGYLKAKTEFSEVAALYKAHYKIPFMGPSPAA